MVNDSAIQQSAQPTQDLMVKIVAKSRPPINITEFRFTQSNVTESEAVYMSKDEGNNDHDSGSIGKLGDRNVSREHTSIDLNFRTLFDLIISK